MTDPRDWLPNTRVGTGVHGDFVLPRGDLILQQIQQYGGHTRPEVALLGSAVRPGDTVVDIGAHVGTFAIPLARRVGPRGLVCAFEPVPSAFDLLRLNIEINGLASTIWPVPLAIADRSESFGFTTPNLRNTGGTFLVETGDIESVALDQWLGDNAAGRTIDVIKIDVEGMEPLVLRGAENTIADHRPVLYLEVNADQYARYGSTLSELAGMLSEYRLYVNRGERNAPNDDFSLVEIPALAEAGQDHFDVLAVPAGRLERIAG